MLSKWLLNISTEGDATTALGDLFQCPIALTIKEFLCMFVTSHVQVSGHCSLSYYYTLLKRAWSHPSVSRLPLDICKH